MDSYEIEDYASRIEDHFVNYRAATSAYQSLRQSLHHHDLTLPAAPEALSLPIDPRRSSRLTTVSKVNFTEAAFVDAEDSEHDVDGEEALADGEADDLPGDDTSHLPGSSDVERIVNFSNTIRLLFKQADKIMKTQEPDEHRVRHVLLWRCSRPFLKAPILSAPLQQSPVNNLSNRGKKKRPEALP
ncbi:hypothetical protein ACHAO4_010188 [Trichoderma viride]